MGRNGVLDESVGAFIDAVFLRDGRFDPMPHYSKFGQQCIKLSQIHSLIIEPILLG